ncbi:MAG: prepilin-type N-terminal cleavage/methylation domain-containing protein [Planctomycetes bacterium]|nr:prepilin-type N-terminal cleavage/methylation domain-containing protein [Planctomycetota bacterium]
MRRGFTLIELLVATGVFLFGFTAAMALFLLGTRARAQADGMLRLSLAASSIVEEIRLEAGREGTASPAAPSGATTPPFAPMDYLGDGLAAIDSSVIDGTTVAEDDNTLAGRLFPYRPQPGIWYRVISCVDEKGDATDKLATALRFDLLVVWNPVPDLSLTLDELARRQRLSGKPEFTAATDQIQFLADFMAKRGFAVRETAWIIRKPSWER